MVTIGAAQLARRLLGQHTGEATAEAPCAVCGLPAHGVPLAKVVSSNFTTWHLLAGDGDSPCCDFCAAIFHDFRFRNQSILAIAGAVTKADQDTWRNIMAAPPREPFVLTWPASRKKHCWLHAALSDAEELRVGCDDRTVHLSVATARDCLAYIERLFAAGATKAEVKMGFYRPAVVQRFGHEIEVIEARLRPLRADGALDILVWLTEREQGRADGDMIMLDEDDRTAAELLGRLANGSAQRDADAIGFWGRGLLSRVQRRTSARSLKTFVEAVAGDIAVRTPALRETLEWIETLDPAKQDRLVERIRLAPRVIVACAQDTARRLRPSSTRSPRPQPQPGDVSDDIHNLFGDA